MNDVTDYDDFRESDLFFKQMELDFDAIIGGTVDAERGRATLGNVRTFETGATRNDDSNEHDYEGFLSPLVIKRFGIYMHKHRTQADEKIRTSDNWQLGMTKESYMKSGWRHFLDWWMEHRRHASRDGIEDALMGLLFNVMGYAHEVLKEKE